jgi:ribosome-associated protein
LNDLIIESIQDIKGKNIVKLDLRDLEDRPADFFIVCEGDSNTQIRAITEEILYNVKHTWRLLPSHLEGMQNARWVCVDFFTTVVHVFHPEMRSFYELEQLWSDARFTEYENL